MAEGLADEPGEQPQEGLADDPDNVFIEVPMEAVNYRQEPPQQRPADDPEQPHEP